MISASAGAMSAAPTVFDLPTATPVLSLSASSHTGFCLLNLANDHKVFFNTASELLKHVEQSGIPVAESAGDRHIVLFGREPGPQAQGLPVGHSDCSQLLRSFCLSTFCQCFPDCLTHSGGDSDSDIDIDSEIAFATGLDAFLPSPQCEQILVSNNFIYHKIIGDGNCLFRAISFVFFGSEKYHLKVREIVVAAMANMAHIEQEYNVI